jgi:hypothetical protein
MKRTKEKDALAKTYTQLEEIRDKILLLLRRTGVDQKDVGIIAATIRRTYFELKRNTPPRTKQPKTGTLNF